jgi:hypothetical protein
MGRFHRPGDEKRSLVVVPPQRREGWLRAEDPRAFLQEMPPEDFTSAPWPLPPRDGVAAPVQGRLEV